MSELSIQYGPSKQNPQVQEVMLTGSVNATSVDHFEKIIDGLRDENFNRFILNMEQVNYVNSTGMGSLVRIADECAQNGGHVVLMGVSPKVKVVFDMLGLDEFFTLTKSMEAAREEVKISAREKRRKAEEVQAAANKNQKRNATVKLDRDYPVEVHCVFCHTLLRIRQKGRFLCPNCTCNIAPVGANTLLFEAHTLQMPFRLVMPCTEVARNIVLHVVKGVAESIGIKEVDRDKIMTCAYEISNTLAKLNDDTMLYTLHILPRPEGLTLRYTDKGKLFPMSDPEFLTKTRFMADKIEYSPAKDGQGNTLQVTKFKPEE